MAQFEMRNSHDFDECWRLVTFFVGYIKGQASKFNTSAMYATRKGPLIWLKNPVLKKSAVLQGFITSKYQHIFLFLGW